MHHGAISRNLTIHNFFHYCGSTFLVRLVPTFHHPSLMNRSSNLDDFLGQLSSFPGAILEQSIATNFASDDIETIREFTGHSNEDLTCFDTLHGLSLLCHYCASVEHCGIGYSQPPDSFEKYMLNSALKFKKLDDQIMCHNVHEPTSPPQMDGPLWIEDYFLC